jgi:hypothetical protein
MSLTIDELVVADPPEAWAAAGFAVEDDVANVGTVRLRFIGPERGKRIVGWTLRGLDAEHDHSAIDGIPTEASDAPPAEPAEHPNGVRSIDHVVVATPDLDRTVEALEAAGLELRRTRRTESYGAPMVQKFFRLGEVILEVIGGDEPRGDGPAGFFGLAYTVADLDATKAFYGDDMGDPKPAVQEGRRIATLRHKQRGLTVASAFMSPGPQEYG